MKFIEREPDIYQRAVAVDSTKYRKEAVKVVRRVGDRVHYPDSVALRVVPAGLIWVAG